MIEDWNRLLTYLAEPEELTLKKYDLLILAGNSLPYLTMEAAKLFHTGLVDCLLLTGGIGHATHYLQMNFEKKGCFFSNQLSEAEMNQEYLLKECGLPQDKIIVENRSRNSGENAAFSLAKISPIETVRNAILLQDPILQRRIKAAFQKVWSNTSVEFHNYVPVLPKLISLQSQPLFDNKLLNGLWQKDYFINLVLGEIPRLRNDERGYGPNGQKFITKVEIPDEIEQSFQRLQKKYSFENKR